MGFRFRKSIKAGPVRINLSKSGVGYSVGGKGFRYTKKANGGTRTTYSIPGTGISYVEETGAKKKSTNTRKGVSSTVPKTFDSVANTVSTNAHNEMPAGKTIYCPYCYRMVEKGTAKCPACGKTISGNGADLSSSNNSNNKPRKPFYKRWWFIAIVGLCLLRGCGAISDASANQNESVPETTMSQSELIELAINLAESILADNIENYDIVHEDGMVTINLWNDGFSVIATMAKGGDSSCTETWKETVSTIKEYSSSVSSTFETLGIVDTPVIVNLLNDQNQDNILVSASNGVIYVDYVSDLFFSESETPITTTDPTQRNNIIYDFSAVIPSDNGIASYVLNTSTGKFHYASCDRVDDINNNNKSFYSGTRVDIISKGYQPCGSCNP